MRLARVSKDQKTGLAAIADGQVKVVWDESLADLDAQIAAGKLAEAGAAAAAGEPVDEDSLTFLPPVSRPAKIICLGLNYRDHAEEAGEAPPT